MKFGMLIALLLTLSFLDIASRAEILGITCNRPGSHTYVNWKDQFDSEGNILNLFFASIGLDSQKYLDPNFRLPLEPLAVLLNFSKLFLSFQYHIFAHTFICALNSMK